ncbi:MAG TPA: aldehyde dehydrogenase family protein [Planctomycetota bacterium]|nr:aldehyde dehydrogenase family protein [Planctomycetota bacterium]
MERDDALALLKPVRLFIEGVFDPADDGASTPVADPTRGVALVDASAAGAADVDRAARAARRAFDGPWGAVDARDRGLLLRRVARLLRHESDAFAALEALASGAPFRVAREFSVAQAAEAFDVAAAVAETSVDAAPQLRGDAACVVRRRPRGAAGVVVSDSDTLLELCWRLAPALATGNSAVAVFPTASCLAAARLGALFEECGFPRGAVQLLPAATPVAARALAEHSLIDALAIAGDAADTLELRRRAAARGTPCSAAVRRAVVHLVAGDAGDPREVARATVAAFAGAAGRAPSRGAHVVVERSAADGLTARLVEQANALRHGCPFDRRTDAPPAPSVAAREAALDAVRRRVDGGARRVAGGEAVAVPGFEGGFHLRPTVLIAPDDGRAVAPDDLPGPIAVVHVVDDDARAVDVARKLGAWGLVVRCGDLRRALRLVDAVGAPTSWVDDGERFDPAVPTGDAAALVAAGAGPAAVAFYTRPVATWVPRAAR